MYLDSCVERIKPSIQANLNKLYKWEWYKNSLLAIMMVRSYQPKWFWKLLYNFYWNFVPESWFKSQENFEQLAKQSTWYDLELDYRTRIIDGYSGLIRQPSK